MSVNFLKIKYGNIPIIIFLFFISVIFSCSLITDYGNGSQDIYTGQVVSNFGTYGVLRHDHTVWTWGWNFRGTLGDGTTEKRDSPVRVANINNVIAFDIREGIGIAADRNGDIWFWGFWRYSSLHPDNLMVKKPVKISRLTGVASLDIAHLNVHLLRNDGTVWHIKIDLTKPADFIEPVRVDGIGNICKVSDYLALSKSGRLYKLNDYEHAYGDLIEGIGDIYNFSSVYNRRTVIVKRDGTVWAWGRNSSGQLGNGTSVDSSVPVRVKNLTNIATVSTNYDWNLALKRDGTVWYWGFLRKDGNTLIGQYVPVMIKNLENVSSIYADGTSIVKKKDGSVWIFDRESRIPEKIPFY